MCTPPLTHQDFQQNYLLPFLTSWLVGEVGWAPFRKIPIGAHLDTSEMAFFCTAHRRDGLKAGEASLEHDLPPAQHVVAMGCGSKLVVATHAESR